MTIVKQISLFDFHELYDIKPYRRFDAIFGTFNVQHIYHLFLIKHFESPNAN